MRKRTSLLAGLLAILCGLTLVLGSCVALSMFLASMEYAVEAEFRELPPDDKELEQWLLGQPGVYIGFVQRDANRVVAFWCNGDTYYWDPVTPDLREIHEKLGYKQLVSYREWKDFRDK